MSTRENIRLIARAPFMPKNSGPLKWEGVDSASDKIFFYQPKMKIFYRSLQQNMCLLTNKKQLAICI